MKEAFSSGKHVFHKIHSMPLCLQNFVWAQIANGVDPVFKAAGEKPRAIEAYKNYWAECFKRVGMIDYAQQLPFHPPAFTRNPMTRDDRLGSPNCTFPIAYAFGDQDFFSSDLGAEAIIEKHSQFDGGKSSIFKVKKSSHVIMNDQGPELLRLMKGFFNGEMCGERQLTVKGNYQWYG